MRGDSSVRSSVSHMAMGDERWRLVTAMLVTYSSLQWRGLAGVVVMPRQGLPSPSHTPYLFPGTLHCYPSILGIWGPATTAFELSVIVPDRRIYSMHILHNRQFNLPGQAKNYLYFRSLKWMQYIFLKLKIIWINGSHFNYARAALQFTLST